MTQSLFSILCFTLAFRKSLCLIQLCSTIQYLNARLHLPLFRSNPIAIDLVSHDSYTDPLFPYSELQMKFCMWSMMIENGIKCGLDYMLRNAALSTPVCNVPCYSAYRMECVEWADVGVTALKLPIDNKHFCARLGVQYRWWEAATLLTTKFGAVFHYWYCLLTASLEMPHHNVVYLHAILQKQCFILIKNIFFFKRKKKMPGLISVAYHCYLVQIC